MYDVNPLGPLMHLKEIERRTALAGQPASGKDRPKIYNSTGKWVIALLKRMSVSTHSATRNAAAN
jgi:hypothetical protein